MQVITYQDFLDRYTSIATNIFDYYQSTISNNLSTFINSTSNVVTLVTINQFITSEVIPIVCSLIDSILVIPLDIGFPYSITYSSDTLDGYLMYTVSINRG